MRLRTAAICGEPMKRVNGRLAKEIEELRKIRDEEIDFSDIPEKRDWSKAVRAKFHRPVKESLKGLPPHPSKLRAKAVLNPN